MNKEDYRYLIQNENTNTVIKVLFDNIEYLVDPFAMKRYDPEKDILYTKNDAQYEIFRKRVSEGTPIKNYKGSKYYKMYLERAKKENPELLFQ